MTLITIQLIIYLILRLENPTPIILKGNVIAQAINQDGVEKIDILEIEAHEIKEINIDLRNCSNYSIEINIDDDYYDSYKLYIKVIIKVI